MSKLLQFEMWCDVEAIRQLHSKQETSHNMSKLIALALLSYQGIYNIYPNTKAIG